MNDEIELSNAVLSPPPAEGVVSPLLSLGASTGGAGGIRGGGPEEIKMDSVIHKANHMYYMKMDNKIWKRIIIIDTG